MVNIKLIKKFRDAVEKEVKQNILYFWANNSLDNENGGFYGEIGNDRKINKEATKGLILNTRILWTFSAAYRLFEEEEYSKIARRAYEYLLEFFWDNVYGGGYWLLDHRGFPVNPKKQIYGQAFMIYSLAEYYQATGDKESLDKAIEIYRLVEENSADPLYKGYIEACSRDWHVTDDLKLSKRDLNEKKSMNTHLHILEAYTNLYRVWPDSNLREKLKELIEVICEKILDTKTFHFKLYFDEDWNSKSDLISFGHDIEGSWLLYEAAQVLKDRNIIEEISTISIKMAEVTLEEGLAEDGGIVYEADSKGNVDEDRHWWPQAEAVVGFINAYQLTRQDIFIDKAYEVWQFINKYLLDREYGEWYWKVSKDGKPDLTISKVNFWKTPYHNGRACFEAMQRLNKIYQEMTGNESAAI